MNQTEIYLSTKHPLRLTTIALILAATVSILWGCAAPYLLVEPAAESATQQEETFVLEPSLFSGAISGVVLGKDGPYEGASVRVQTASTEFLTDADGEFTIPDLVSSGPITITAWAKSYFIEAAVGQPGGEDVVLQLRQHPRVDSLNYDWQPAADCGECHPSYAEWQADAHSQSATNPRFLSIYKGTDIYGNRSPLTNYETGIPKAPNLDEPYFGPGMKLDSPMRDGNCSTCHAPQIAKLPTNDGCAWSGCHVGLTLERSDELADDRVSPVGATGTAAEGISCDFCHKIGKVRVDKKTGLPKEDAPGILSLSIYRPDREAEPEAEFLLGNIPDVSRGRDTFNPLYAESQYCASCHFGVFSNTITYNSFGEWLESDYSDPEFGQTCQDCHMPVAERYQKIDASLNAAAPLDNLPPLLTAVLSEEQKSTQPDKNYFAYPEKGGVYRERDQVHNHQMPGATDRAFLQSAVEMTTESVIEDDALVVTVRIENVGAGHHVPTGSAMRQLLLDLDVMDETGEALTLLDGSTLPDWSGDLAGQPGKGYAKILVDAVTGESPSIAQWRLVTVESDTRIAANATDTTRYVFALPTSGSADEIRVNASLYYRRSFQTIMEWKGWDTPDILMAENRLTGVSVAQKEASVLKK